MFTLHNKQHTKENGLRRERALRGVSGLLLGAFLMSSVVPSALFAEGIMVSGGDDGGVEVFVSGGEDGGSEASTGGEAGAGPQPPPGP